MFSLAASSGRLCPAAGPWQLRPTLTATGNQTISFTMPRRVKRRFGISITTFTQALRGARLPRWAGAWSCLERTAGQYQRAHLVRGAEDAVLRAGRISVFGVLCMLLVSQILPSRS